MTWPTIGTRGTDGTIHLSVRGKDDHLKWGTFHKTRNAKTIAFRVKRLTAADQIEADHTQQFPVSQLIVNASLSLRIALRRLLYIDLPLPHRKPMASEEFAEQHKNDHLVSRDSNEPLEWPDWPKE